MAAVNFGFRRREEGRVFFLPDDFCRKDGLWMARKTPPNVVLLLTHRMANP
jgi:hypothetical protein